MPRKERPYKDDVHPYRDEQDNDVNTFIIRIFEISGIRGEFCLSLQLLFPLAKQFKNFQGFRPGFSEIIAVFRT